MLLSAPAHNYYMYHLEKLIGGREERIVTYVIAGPCVDVKDKARVEECPHPLIAALRSHVR